MLRSLVRTFGSQGCKRASSSTVLRTPTPLRYRPLAAAAAQLNSPRLYYTTRSIPPDLQPDSQPTSSSSNPTSTRLDPEQEKRISILENTVAAPWLYTLPPDLTNRIRVSYTLVIQIVIYLAQPIFPDPSSDPASSESPLDVTGQFLVAFGALPAPPESEIGRARKAVKEIVRAVVYHLGSVPEDSELWKRERELFDVFGALRVVHDAFLLNEASGSGGEGDPVKDLENWRAFWTRAQPVILGLGMKLDEKGFGLDFDEDGEKKE